MKNIFNIIQTTCYLVLLLILFTNQNANANSGFKIKDKTISLSILEGLEHNQRHYTLGFVVNRREGVGYIEVGILLDDNNSTKFNGYNTLGLGYNWHVYNIGKHKFSFGFGAIAAFNGKCNDSVPNNRKERDYCQKEDNQNSSYGDSDLLLYPEVRLTLDINKNFDITLNVKKLFSINDSFDTDSLFLGTSFLMTF